MRLTPRTVFASSLVVIGCGGGSPHPGAPPVTHVTHVGPVAVADAGVADAPADAREVPEVTVTPECFKPEVMCNPPMRTRPLPPIAIEVPPITVVGAVVSVDDAPGGVYVVADAGSDRGISRTATATLVDATGQVVARGDGTVVRLDQTRTVVLVKIARGRVRPDHAVRFTLARAPK